MSNKQCANPACREIFPDRTEICWKCGGTAFRPIQESAPAVAQPAQPKKVAEPVGEDQKKPESKKKKP